MLLSNIKKKSFINIKKSETTYNSESGEETSNNHKHIKRQQNKHSTTAQDDEP